MGRRLLHPDIVRCATIVQVPAPDWKPAGFVPFTSTQAGSAPEAGTFGRRKRSARRSSYLLWIVLFLNVTAGIGILEQASPMIQRLFSPRVSAIAAGGFVGLLSIFNMGGRSAWASWLRLHWSEGHSRHHSSCSGSILFLFLTSRVRQRSGSVPIFVCVCWRDYLHVWRRLCYDPGVSARDLFGTIEVGAIHGRSARRRGRRPESSGPLLVSHLYEASEGRRRYGGGTLRSYPCT